MCEAIGAGFHPPYSRLTSAAEQQRLRADAGREGFSSPFPFAPSLGKYEMYEIERTIIFTANLLYQAIKTFSRLRQKISPRYRAQCFFRACDNLCIPGETEWNFQVAEILMHDYGYI